MEKSPVSQGDIADKISSLFLRMLGLKETHGWSLITRRAKVEYRKGKGNLTYTRRGSLGPEEIQPGNWALTRLLGAELIKRAFSRSITFKVGLVGAIIVFGGVADNIISNGDSSDPYSSNPDASPLSMEYDNTIRYPASYREVARRTTQLDRIGVKSWELGVGGAYPNMYKDELVVNCQGGEVFQPPGSGELSGYEHVEEVPTPEKWVVGGHKASRLVEKLCINGKPVSVGFSTDEEIEGFLRNG